MPTPLTPNVKTLILYKMSVDAIPDGGGLKAGIDFILTPGKMAQGFKDASTWVQTAIVAVRNAADPNPWKQSSDEEIAGELVKQIEARKTKQRQGISA